jgi:hypothetical protein
MGILSAGLSEDERLVVSPRRARHMLDIGNTRLYELLQANELTSISMAAHAKSSFPQFTSSSPDDLQLGKFCPQRCLAADGDDCTSIAPAERAHDCWRTDMHAVSAR